MTLNSTIKSLARKLSILVTAMANPQPAAQKSHFTHAERYEANLDPEVWLSQLQAMQHDLPQDNHQILNEKQHQILNEKKTDLK